MLKSLKLSSMIIDTFISPTEWIPMASIFSTTPHLYMTITGSGMWTLIIFMKKTRLYDGSQAANLSKLCFLLKLKKQNKQKLSKLTQNVLLRGYHNRIYHYNLTSKFSQTLHYHSVELPLDWLL